MEEPRDKGAQPAGQGACARQTPVVVARQPLFDARLDVAAFELLYRTPVDTAQGSAPACLTAPAVAAAALDLGVRHLANGHPLHLQLPAGVLESGFRPQVPPAGVVIELPEGLQPGPELLSRLELLRGEGVRVALHDFDVGAHSLQLIERADVVKLDVSRHGAEELAARVQSLRRYPVRLVAGRIETAETLVRCRQLGIDLFQGAILHQPQVTRTRRVPAGRRSVLQQLLRLAAPGLSLDEVEAVVRTDPGLSYRILRCINSSYYHRPRTVRSLREAVQLLGMAELHRLCWTMLLAGLDERPRHACVQALQRARMCELLCNAAGLPGAEGCFVTGMLSMLDVLLGEPLQDVLATLPIGADMAGALLFRRGEMGELLRCVERYERGDWRPLQFRDLGAERIVAAYLLATEWADLAWRHVPHVANA